MRCTTTNRFLIFHRRDGFEYVTLIKGSYESEQLPKLISGLCTEERDRILGVLSVHGLSAGDMFVRLWNDIWVNHDAYHFSAAFMYAKRKWVTNFERIHRLITDATPEALTPPWGIPKGRCSKRETEITAAMREFGEESGIKDMPYALTGKSYHESFIGSDGQRYSTTYYGGECTEEVMPHGIDTPQCGIRTRTLTFESSEVKWVTSQEARAYLVPRMADLLDKAERDAH